MMARSSIEVVEGKGVEGDRYSSGTGTWSSRPGGGRHLTLIAREDLFAAERDLGTPIDPQQVRRNLVISGGIDLRSLIGHRFRIGAVVCLGVRECHPCAHLEELTRKGMLRALVNRGGLRADVIEGGLIRVGDAVVALERIRQGGGEQ